MLVDDQALALAELDATVARLLARAHADDLAAPARRRRPGRVRAWWRRAFPPAPVATATDYAAARAQLLAEGIELTRVGRWHVAHQIAARRARVIRGAR